MKVIDLLITIVIYKIKKEDFEKVIINLIVYSKYEITICIIDNFGDKHIQNYCNANNIEYIKTNKNIGFGAAHNLVALDPNRKAKYNLILNPDVVITGNNIEMCIEYMELNSNIAILSPKLLYANLKTQQICRKIPDLSEITARVLNRIVKHNSYFQEENQYGNVNVPFIHGACLFVRSDIYKKINGFDARYFLYVEDIDLCRRAWGYGRVFHYGDATAMHDHAAYSRRKIKYKIIHFVSFVKYFIKWGVTNDNKIRKLNKEFEILNEKS